MKTNNRLYWISTLFTSLSLLSVLSIFTFVITNKFPNQNIPKVAIHYEKTISRRSSPRQIFTTTNNYLDYDYKFINPAYNAGGELGRKDLLASFCNDEDVTTYQATDPIIIKTIDNPTDPPDEQTTTTTITPGTPKETLLKGYVCKNSLFKIESFSEYFNSGHYIYSLMKMFEDGNSVLLPVLDSLNSIRFHSSARDNKSNIKEIKEYFYPEAFDASKELANNTSQQNSFRLWARWSEGILSKTLITQSSTNDIIERMIENYSINRWLNVFSDYFLRTNGIGCNEVWGSFDSTNYYWNVVLTHELYHHYFSPFVKDKSDNSNLPIDYSYYKLRRNVVNNDYSSFIETKSMSKKVLDRIQDYFSEIKRDFWDNDPLDKYSSNIDLSTTIGITPISYSIDVSRLTYMYEPEELFARLYSLLTFYWEDLDPRLLELPFSSNYEVCSPSFFLQDYVAFKNSNYSINPFDSNNFSKALAIILESMRFNIPFTRLTKAPKEEVGISIQGWSTTNAYQKLVLEEINPQAGSVSTKRNIFDLSWSASNFFVRESFNSAEKKYLECTDDYDNVTFTDNFSGSCQMWTTPLFDPNELFEEFFTRTTEVNTNEDPLTGDIYVGFVMYFWNDINNDGQIQENEKIKPNIDKQPPLNARQMNIEPGNICKISIVKNLNNIEFRRYVDGSFESELQNVDSLCTLSWSSKG